MSDENPLTKPRHYDPPRWPHAHLDPSWQNWRRKYDPYYVLRELLRFWRIWRDGR